MQELSLEEMFAAGAKSAAAAHGMSEKDAEAFSGFMRKEARRRLKVVEDDEDDEDDEEKTWWDRNKKWALPSAIGLGAFLLGADAGRNGRPDRNYFSNAGNLFLERLKALFGIPDSALWRSMTHTDQKNSPATDLNPKVEPAPVEIPPETYKPDGP